MINAWTGGQYSLLRALAGAYLCIHSLDLLRRGDSPAPVTALFGLAAILSLLLTIGLHDRIAAAVLLLAGAALAVRDPPGSGLDLLPAGFLLLAHLCLPSAPYGSWATRGRPDPGRAWRMPEPVYRAAWIVQALGYAYRGYTGLTGSWQPDGATPVRWASAGLDLAYAPGALVAPARPWLWSAMLLAHLSRLALTGFADASVASILWHLFTFDPAWIPRRAARTVETIFYDGTCGLCHGAVRFVLAEDRQGDAFRFAPLDSDVCRRSIPEETRRSLPDSLVVRTHDGRLLTRSAAVLHVLRALGGGWRALAGPAALVPPDVRDHAYDLVAATRRRLFRKPADACPVVDAHLRARFDA